MKKTEIKLPVPSAPPHAIERLPPEVVATYLSTDRPLLQSPSSWDSLSSDRSLIISFDFGIVPAADAPSTIFRMKGVHRFADNSSDSIACSIS